MFSFSQVSNYEELQKAFNGAAVYRNLDTACTYNNVSFVGEVLMGNDFCKIQFSNIRDVLYLDIVLRVRIFHNFFRLLSSTVSNAPFPAKEKFPSA